VTGGLGDDPRPQSPAAAPIWTPVECWPLPR
jgi:hypothetical protein